MIKLLFCSNSKTLYGGGAESWLQRILPILKESKFDVNLLYLPLSTQMPEHIKVLKRYKINMIKLHVNNNFFCDIVREYIKAFSKIRPDIIICDNSVHAHLATYWAKKAGIKVIFVFRTDQNVYWDIANNFLFGDLKHRVHGVVTVSKELRRMVDNKISKKISLMYCPSSVPASKFTASWNEHNFHALYLGRFISSQKRILNLVNQLVEVSRQRPWFYATLYGDGPDYKQVQNILERCSGHRIKLGGVLKRDEVYCKLAQAQCLVLLSEYEGLSNTVQEAMTCGLPVIMRKISSGIEDVVVHNESGLLIDHDQDLGTAVDALFYSVDLWKKISLNSMAIARKEFAIETAAQNWINFFNEINPKKFPDNISVPDIDEIRHKYVNLKSNKSKSLLNVLIKAKNIAKASNRDLCIWGAGEYGLNLMEILRGNGIDISYFLDSDSDKSGSYINGLFVKDPNFIGLGDIKPVVFVGSMFNDEICSHLERMDFKKNYDYFIPNIFY